MQDNAATRMSHCRATIASGTVLIPTASAPSRANARFPPGFHKSARQRQIHAGTQLPPALPRGATQTTACQTRIISARQIHEARQSRPGCATQRILPHQIDMIGHEHEIARPKKSGSTPPAALGEQQIPDAIFREHPDRKCDECHRMTLIKMRSPA